jgi:hypothetical protein
MGWYPRYRPWLPHFDIVVPEASPVAHSRLSLLRPEHCSATVNVACGMLAEWLDCSVDEALRALQARAGEDFGRLERIAAWALALHSVLIGHCATCSCCRLPSTSN